jgi:lipoprotein-releasing system permease protein
MNVAFFLAQKIKYANKNSFSATAIQVSTVSIAVGVTVLLLAVAILEGFRAEIQRKMFSVSAHIRIDKYDLNHSYEDAPISKNAAIYSEATKIENVAYLQSYAYKAALLKHQDEVQGILLKGMGDDWNTTDFLSNLKQGNLPDFTTDTASYAIVVSQKIANKLRLSVGDKVITYFLQDPPRYRRLTVAAIYETGMEDFDDNLVIADLKLIQEINGWQDTLVGGFEIFVKNFENLDSTFEQVYEATDFDLTAEKITDTYLPIFDWLNMLDRNVQVLIVLISIVACFNMISTLLIMILERTNMVGILQAVGATNAQIRAIFLWTGLKIIAQGMFYGNLLGLGLVALQYYFKIIPLDVENYYMNAVPIAWNLYSIMGINVITLLVTLFSLLLPTAFVLRIKPIAAIKFN